jgi:hypothetical protein
MSATNGAYLQPNGLGEANGIYSNLTNATTMNGGTLTPHEKPDPFFVPSTVKSTLGSPVRSHINWYSEALSLP